MAHLPAASPGGSARSRRCDGGARSRGSRSASGRALIVLFLLLPDRDDHASTRSTPRTCQGWPLAGFSTKWFSSHIPQRGDARTRCWLSVKAAASRPRSRIVLGSMAAFAVHRFRFFGRESISFLLVLPLALPGDHHRDGAELVLHASGRFNFVLWTIVVGPRDLLHRRSSTTTSLARLRRTQTSLSRRRWISAPTAGRRSGT